MGRSAPPVIFTPRVTQAGSWEEWWQEINTDLSTASPAALFRKQTHLRSVVTFRARNVAQLGLHVYERVSDTDRRRDRSSVAARALAVTDGVMTPYELVFALVGDLDLYDRAHWLVVPDADLPSGWMIRRLPPSWVTPERESAFEVHSWRVTSGKESVVIPAEHILSFTGYSPTDPRRGSPAVDSLRDTLQEQIEAAVYRGQIWKRGGRVSSVIERPKDAPQWSDPARESFREDWYAKYTGRGSKAGGTPILEDGMTLKRVDFNAQEQQYVEAAKLSLTTVAAAFHVNPTMLGQNDGANYSNVREFRKALYTDTLGPLLAQIEGRLNAFLLPMLGVDPARYYLEFNIEEKLQGNFEEQATALQSATGAPWMTRNEARAMRNLPAVDGGDLLVTPLNVLIGGQASARDSGTQNRRSITAGALKARPRRLDERAAQVVAEFFARQGAAVNSRIGAGRDDWWDAERWDGELAATVTGIYLLTATEAGRATLSSIGVSPDDYDEPATMAFLTEAARKSAESINETTREHVQAAIDEGEDVGEVFTSARATRAAVVAATLVTFAAGFGTTEAARQQSPGATKTWRTNSGNPRPSHAAMDGETVPVDGTFSNGLTWPGAFGPVDEVAGCVCDVVISIPEQP